MREDFGECFVEASDGDPAPPPRDRDERRKETLKNDPRSQLICCRTLDKEKEVSIGDGILRVETESCVAQDLVQVDDRRLWKAPRIDSSKSMLCSRKSAPFGSEVSQHRIGSGGVGEDVMAAGFRCSGHGDMVRMTITRTQS